MRHPSLTLTAAAVDLFPQYSDNNFASPHFWLSQTVVWRKSEVNLICFAQLIFCLAAACYPCTPFWTAVITDHGSMGMGSNGPLTPFFSTGRSRNAIWPCLFMHKSRFTVQFINCASVLGMQCRYQNHLEHGVYFAFVCRFYSSVPVLLLGKCCKLFYPY